LSLLVVSCSLAAGILIGRAIARALRRPPADGAPSSAATPGRAMSPGNVGEADSKTSVDPLEGFFCHLGDVILAKTGEEAWLAGALVFRERLPMAALFVAPEAGTDRAIFVRPMPETSLLWLAPTAEGSLEIGREPPSSLEHAQERFERTRRIPYRVERIGTGAPDVGLDVILAEYRAATGDRLIVITGAGQERAWRGRVLEEGTYDLLPGSSPPRRSRE
jgi:hypothetical protein